MKLNDFFAVTEGYAPKSLSDEYCAKYGAYDNSGILIDTGDEIRLAVFSLDFSNRAIEEAKKLNANLIVTHHPAIYGKIGNIRVSDFEPFGAKIVSCIKNGISVISAHLNLDATVGGIDESLMQAVCKATDTEDSTATVMHPLSYGGYGRVYEIRETTVADLARGLEKELSTSRIRAYGEMKRVKRVASFCGAGVDENAIAFAVERGADAVISSDFKHHLIALANEKGLAVIDITHYASEFYGFEKFYKKISREVEIPCALVTEEGLL